MEDMNIERLGEIQGYASYFNKLNQHENYLFSELSKLKKTELENISSKYADSEKLKKPINILRKRTADILLNGDKFTRVDFNFNVKKIDKEVNLNGNPFRLFENPFSVYHVFFLHRINGVKKYMENIANDVIKNIGVGRERINIAVSDFQGNRNLGTDRVWFAAYNKEHPNQQKAKQLFFEINATRIFCAVNDRRNGKNNFIKTLDLTNVIDSSNSFNNSLLTFFIENKEEILKSEEVKDDKNTVDTIQDYSDGLIGGKDRRIYKLSISEDFDESIVESFIEDGVVIIHESEPALESEKTTQIVKFDRAKKGDFFYLCYRSKVLLLGQFISTRSKPNKRYHALMERKFAIVERSRYKIEYREGSNKWTPDFKSTFTEIPLEELSDANKWIFKPYFNLRFELVNGSLVLKKGDNVEIIRPKKTKVNSDSFSNIEDQLNIKDDAKAFATILASKNADAPLAIALLGNWGSGKSFFMDRIQRYVKELAKYQGFLKIGQENFKYDNEDESDNEFFKGIVQIKFNAWSYMDSNLWASIIVKIFEELKFYIHNQDGLGSIYEEKIEEDIIRKLGVKTNEVRSLEEKKSQVLESIKRNTGDRLNLEKELVEKEKKLKEISGKDIYSENRYNFDVNSFLNEIGENLEINEEKLVEIFPENTRGDISELIEISKSKTLFIKKFFNAKSILITALILIIISFIPYINNFIFNEFNYEDTWVAQLLVSLSGTFGLFYNRYKKVISFLQPIKSYLRRDKRSYEEKLRYVYHAQRDNVEDIKSELEKLEKEITKVDKYIQEREIEELELKSKLKYTLSTEAINSFITEKSTDGEYQKHLGIISAIRRDFETLSKLLPKHLSEQTDDPGEKYKRVERIILYIDDLDRCPDHKVVEVLEAVHLLLTYPLFMVVVGIDKRCAKNALIHRNILPYIEKTRLKTTKDLNEEFDLELTDPEEYLEKIFQIPFQLKEPGDKGFDNLIESLLENDSTEKEREEMDELRDIDAKFTDDDGNDIIIPEEEIKSLEELSRELEPEFEEIKASLEEVDLEERISIEKPDSLVLSYFEKEALKNFSWMIGKTPRRIKRFVNIYRIIRSHKEFSEEKNHENSRLYTIMFALSWGIGEYSSFANDFFKYISGLDDEVMIRKAIDHFIEKKDRDLENDQRLQLFKERFTNESNFGEEWSNIHSKLMESRVNELTEIYEFVKRFSFV